MKNDIDKVIKKLFGKYKDSDDVNSSDFMHQSFDESDNVSNLRCKSTPDDLIKEFLFYQTDFAKILNKIIKDRNDTEQKNS